MEYVGWRAKGTRSTWAWFITLLLPAMKRSGVKDPVTHQHLNVPKQEKTSLIIYVMHLCISSHTGKLFPKGRAGICRSALKTLDYLVSNERENQAKNSLRCQSFAHNPLHRAAHFSLHALTYNLENKGYFSVAFNHTWVTPEVLSLLSHIFFILFTVYTIFFVNNQVKYHKMALEKCRVLNALTVYG